MTGSVKQIEWASKIKAQWTAQLDELVNQAQLRAQFDERDGLATAHKTKDLADITLSAVNTVKAQIETFSASQIIDHRTDKPALLASKAIAAIYNQKYSTQLSSK